MPLEDPTDRDARIEAEARTDARLRPGRGGDLYMIMHLWVKKSDGDGAAAAFVQELRAGGERKVAAIASVQQRMAE